MTASGQDLQPVIQTRRAVEMLERWSDASLLASLRDQARAVRDLVPDLVALSVSYGTPHLTLTLRLAEEQVEALARRRDTTSDGVTAPGRVDEPGCEALDEDRWQAGARADRPDWIRSSLTLPVLGVDDTTGWVTLHACSADAFQGQHDGLAAACGAWAPGAVSNADLDFGALDDARRGPEVLRTHDLVATASGLMAERDRTTPAAARLVLLSAAEAAGVDPARLAELVLEQAAGPDRSPGSDGGPLG